MADLTQLDRLRQGAKDWNEWRIKNPGILIDLTDANLAGINLTRANLVGANLAGANLAGANLARADLTGADLTGADLTGAKLTGACIGGWFFNSRTNFDSMICDYVFLTSEIQEKNLVYTNRRPVDPSKNYEDGEFARIARSLRFNKKSDEDKKLILHIDIEDSSNDLTDAIAWELANLCKALNAYHIACGGNGLTIDDWNAFVSVREFVGGKR
ncbi:MAG: pentapeptide repeat-containing protein [Cyanobacteria bacterium SBLK]|nr:pentapeptide repeat-containing protein [Cyanobacteria bacterium SBLK]